MLYIESKRLGKNTAIGLLSIAFIILLQGVFGAWEMEKITDESSNGLVVFSDTQVESLTLKSMLINLRKLEKDTLLYNKTSFDKKRTRIRWERALLETNIQFLKLEEELNESEIKAKSFSSLFSNAFSSYKDGITLVLNKMSNSSSLTQYEALLEMAKYKKHIYAMEKEIDKIVELAETQETKVIAYLKNSKDRIYWILGLSGLGSAVLSIILSIWIVKKNMHISRTLEHQALHDTLTGVLNRRGLAIVIDNYKQGGVMAYLDLDRFKLVNDLYGHTAGDELLVSLTKKIALYCKEKKCTISRVGGDEFVIWFNNIKDIKSAGDISKEIVSLIENHPFTWMGQKMHLGASVGLAVAKKDFLFTEVLSRADAACNMAKIPGNSKVMVYEESDPDLIEIRKEEKWAAKIPQMIVNEEFCLYGQRIVPLQNIDSKGHVEILIRGISKEGKIIPPGLFLPAAERFGLMPNIDRWVIETLLSSKLDEDMDFSINISGHTLADKEYLPKLVKLLSKSGKAHQIIFEITESVAMTSIDTAQHYIRVLKAIGCRFSLDDFGSGFSSFAYLRDLYVDYLKIDGSLIKVLTRSKSDKTLVQAIINMAASLELKTVAEYVETQELADILNEMNVDYAQGYGLHKPEPLANLASFKEIKYKKSVLK